MVRPTMWYRTVSAGTFMVAAAMTGGDVLVRDAVWEHNRPLISKLLEMGIEVQRNLKVFVFVLNLKISRLFM